MKIFNVSLRVSITQIAELPDNPPETPKEPFNDNPLKAAEKLFDRAERLMAPRGVAVVPGFGMYPEQQDGASLTQNICIQAETVEDLQAILKMFADTVKAIHTVPNSILRDAIQNIPSIG